MIEPKFVDYLFADYLELDDPVEILKYAVELLTPVAKKELSEHGFKTEEFMRLISVERSIFRAIYKLSGCDEQDKGELG